MRTTGSSWPKADHTFEGGEFKWNPVCAFCFRGGSLDSPHTAEQCPLAGSINKVRAHAGYIPMERRGGEWVRVDTMVEMDVVKEVKELKAKVADLRKELDALKGQKGSKAKEVPKASSSKRKADAAAPAPPSKKSKTDKGDKKKGSDAPKKPEASGSKGKKATK